MKHDLSSAMALLGELYQSAADINSLSRFLEQFSAHMGCPSALLRFYETPQNQVQYSLYHGYDAQWQRAYDQYFCRLDPNLEVLAVNPPGCAYSGDLVAQRDDYAKSEYFNDYVLKIDKPHAIGGYVVRTPELTGMLALQRSHAEKPFSPDEIDYLNLFFPHFHKAWLLYREFAETRAAGKLQERILNRSRHGLILFNQRAEPIYMNARAEQLRAAGEVRFTKSELFVGPAHHPVALSPLIKAAITGAQTARNAPRLVQRTTTASDGDTLLVTAMPITPEVLNDEAVLARYRAVLVITIPLDGAAADRQLLGALYGLTQAETALALALAQGDELNAIAECRGVSRNTLKSQLRSIYRKTDCARQTELCYLISQLPPLHA